MFSIFFEIYYLDFGFMNDLFDDLDIDYYVRRLLVNGIWLLYEMIEEVR